MYNPDACLDSHCEWIELYNNETEKVDLSKWFIIDGKYNRTIGNYNISTKEYLILTRNNNKYEEFFGNNDSIWNESDGNYSIINVSMSLLNGGETLVLTNGTYNNSVTYDGKLANGNNKSLELIDNFWIESNENGGTPGRKNTGNINSSGNSSNNEDLDVELAISNPILNLTDVLNISGNITAGINGSLTIKIARNISKNKTSWKYKWYLEEDYNFSINNKTSFTEIFNKSIYWTLPDDLIMGNYKLLVTLKYFDGNKSRFKYENDFFYINGLEDLGEHNLTIISSPDKMRFGDVETLFIRFDSNNYNFKNISFAAYLYSPRWALIDLDDKTLRTRPYETNIAVNFENINRGTTTYISIPLFSKRNCDDDYNAGTYKGKIRGYENRDDVITKEFGIKISDVNDAMCPKTSTRYKSCGGYDAPIVVQSKKKNTFTYDNIKFEIEIPKNISKKFNVAINTTNLNDIEKDFEIWSYVYSGRTALMEREKNKVKIKISSNETKEIILKNIITEKNIPVKDYKVMVKINSPNRKSKKSYSEPINLLFKKEKINEIKSFYTRAKKFDNKIKLYAGCENKEDQLILETSNQIFIKDCDKTVLFEVNIEEGPNLFFLSIENNQSISDREKMLILANKTDITSHKETSKIYEMINTYSKPEESEQNSNLITGQAVKETNVLYESSNTKLKKLIKYLLSTMFIVLLGLFVLRKNETPHPEG